VKPIAKQSNKEAGFTIVELLTVMSIIIILMGLLAPAMNRARRYARKVSQKNQFHSIDIALEMFRAEFDGYPPSDALDPISRQYCGAMKLAEAMLGQDLLGFHQDSIFRSDGQDGSGRALYPVNPYEYNLKARKEHYLPLENANAYRLNDIYPNVTTSTFNGLRFVLCDVYTRVMNLNTGKKIGMPVLYYKADTSKTAHNLDNPDDPNNIYNYRDNHALLGLGVPWDPNEKHPLFTDPKIFYKITRNRKVKKQSLPRRADSFILISAGYDGLYGTKDDIVNFDR
jgi:type II secretory pathway pseudopilin PulG